MPAEVDSNWNVLWSHEQNAFHVEEMHETVIDGLNALYANEVRQFILVGTGMTRDEASEFTKRFRDVLHVRQVAIDAKR